MENAGLSAAIHVTTLTRSKKVTILVGKGNNGGDGLCMGRHLINFGFDVRFILASDRLSELAGKQFSMLDNPNITVGKYEYRKELIVDALLGSGAKGDPDETYSLMINAANNSGNKVLALDIPSGLNPHSGKPGKSCIRANWTVTFGLPKICLLKASAKKFVGVLYLGYIGWPVSMYELLRVKNPFTKERIIKIKK